MKVEMVILAFPQGSPVTYDTSVEGIDEIEIEDDKVRIDFVAEGRKWAREIPISKLQFIEYPTESAKMIEEENIYKGQEGGDIE